MSNLPATLIESVLDAACQLQQIPAPTFQENERAQWMHDHFLLAGLQGVEIDPAGNVWARLAGAGGPPLVISAHLDTVHPLSRPLPLERTPARITGPGIGDNSLGLAALLGLARHFQGRSSPLPGDLILIANTCEEGMGNLHGMRAAVDRLGSRPLAYLIVEGLGLGNVYHSGLGVERYCIRVATPGGHSWADYGSPSAIHELAGIISQVTDLRLPQSPRSSLNFGTIEGGTSINTIAALASCTLDLRSESSATLEKMVASVQTITGKFNRPGVVTSLERIGQRPAGAISLDHPLVQLVKFSLERLGIESHIGSASTDANVPLSRGLPAVCFGLTTGGKSHTVSEYIDVKPVGKGLRLLTQVVQKAWDSLASPS